MNHFDKDKLISSIVCGVISFSIFLIAATIIPIVIVISPVPIIYTFIKDKDLYGFIALTIGFTCMIFSGETYWSVLTMMYSIPLILVIAHTIQRKISLTNILLITSSTLFVLTFIGAYVYKISASKDVFQTVFYTINSFFDFIVNNAKSSGISESEIRIITDNQDKIVELFNVILPSFVWIFSIIISFINYKVTLLLTNRFSMENIHIESIRDIVMPRRFFLFVGLSFLTIFALKYFGFKFYFELGLNLYFVFSFSFLVNGIATFSYFLNRKGIRGFITYSIVVLMFIIRWEMILTIIGIADGILELRKKVERV